MSHDAATHGTENPFSPADLAELHADDRIAGRNIVLLMLFIFLVGVTLYAVVAYSVAT